MGMTHFSGPVNSKNGFNSEEGPATFGGATFEEGTGFLSFSGDARFWIDVDFPVQRRTAAAGQPTFETLVTPITAPVWAVNDYFDLEGNEIVHQWAEGTPWYFHFHLITGGTDTTDRYVKFQVEFTYAPVGEALQDPVVTLTSDDILIPADTPDRTHLIASIDNYTPIAGTGIGVQVYPRLTRIAATGTAPTDDPFIPMMQIHILCNSVGSRQIGDK